MTLYSAAQGFLLIALARASLSIDKALCQLDPKVNADSWPSYKDEIGNLFASACGRNRGVFVVNPPDGHTYGCANFPPAWGVKDANGIKLVNDSAEAVSILNKFVVAAYDSTPSYIRAKDPSACDMEALTALTCGKENPWKTAPWAKKLGDQPIRAVNLGGLFVLERWITPNLLEWGPTTSITDQLSFSENCAAHDMCDVIHAHWDSWYKPEDFQKMKELGLNSIRLTVGYWYFSAISKVPSHPYILPEAKLTDVGHPITKIISYAQDAGLQVILHLSPVKLPTQAASVSTAATVASSGALAGYVSMLQKKHGLTNVMALEIGSELIHPAADERLITKSVEAIRSVDEHLPVLIYETSTLPEGQKNVFIGTKVYHGTNVADIASDTAKDDRQKMYAHEKIACGFKAPLHFTTCTRKATMVSEFSLAIDNCLAYVDADFGDYGQCSNIEERAQSPWWSRHYYSFAMRQLVTYERELGWAFNTYKMGDIAEKSPKTSVALWSFRKAVEKGYINLAELNVDACAHYPADDWVAGDNVTKSPKPTFAFAAPDVRVVSANGPFSFVGMAFLLCMGVLVGVLLAPFLSSVMSTLKLRPRYTALP
eukprot:gb/GEZN01003758.1/.p1 GENE.gb/GEZN01003758.1/~~gb/GEZN01003758.1/.p1  ORF type:complete len:598 (-),score=96.03 gb/GEZN01003758.1/:275-2068(-)